jgi:hypothetical protein
VDSSAVRSGSGASHRLDILESVSRRLLVDVTTLRRWCRDGKVHALRLPSGQWRIWVDEERLPVAMSFGTRYRGRPRR